MNAAFRQHVDDLSGFPLDPQVGAAWLWSAADARLLWMSEAAQTQWNSGVRPIFNDVLRGLAGDLAQPQPELEPIRVQQLATTASDAKTFMTCLCRVVRISGGGLGLLAAVVPPRIRPQPAKPVAPPVAAASQRGPGETETPKVQVLRPQAPVEATSADSAPILPAAETPVVEEARKVVSLPLVAEVPSAALPSEPVQPVPPPQNAPAPREPLSPVVLHDESDDDGSDEDDDPFADVQRKTVRFVWQTDAQGRFVHLSRELAEAVGARNATMIGLTFEAVADKCGIDEAEDIIAAFKGRQTWSAGPALWPSQDSEALVPVEFGGVVVRENGHFAGFRGYGIARPVVGGAKPTPTTGSAPQPIGAPGLVTSRDQQAVLASLLDSRPRENKPQNNKPDAVENGIPVRKPLPVIDRQQPAPENRSAAGLRAFAEEKTTRPASEKPSTEPQRGLTDEERQAFREIARALDGGFGAIESGPLLGDEPTAATPIVSYEALAERRARRKPAVGATEPIVPVLDRLPIAIAVTQDGRCVYTNARMLDLTGHRDLDAFAAAGGIQNMFAQGQAADTAQPQSFLIRGAQGRDIWVDTVIQPTEWRKAPAMLLAMTPQARAMDNMGLRSMELDLLSVRTENRELQAVLTAAVDGIVTLDDRGIIMKANEAAGTLFGFAPDEMVGKSLSALLMQESIPSIADYLDSLRASAVSPLLKNGRDIVGKTREGHGIPLFVTITRLTEGGLSSRYCAVFKNMTNWKQAENELQLARERAEAASANKSDFLASVSHELRTPLNAIIGFSEAMMSEQLGPMNNDRYRQYARDIHSSGNHLLSLVNDLLDMSKIAAGKLELSFERVDLNAIVAGAVAMIEPQANRARVLIRTQMAGQLPPVVGDVRSIRQIVLNLLSNATRYTKPGGHAIVTTSLSEHGEAVIRIRDTGVGMSKEELSFAMEPFRQVKGHGMDGGTGLGLPLTKALVEANRAVFRIESERGAGTLTEVVFPSSRVLAD